MSFCYHRCYSTEPKTYRRDIDIFTGSAGEPGSAGVKDILGFGGLAGSMSGVHEGSNCHLVDDMYYCGTNDCEQCDYEF